MKLSNDPIVRLIRQHGYLTVQRATNYLVLWAYVRAKIGHDPSNGEIKRYMGMKSGRSLDREAAAWRVVTGGTPPSAVLAAAGVTDARMARMIGPDPALGVELLPFVAGVA